MTGCASIARCSAADSGLNYCTPQGSLTCKRIPKRIRRRKFWARTFLLPACPARKARGSSTGADAFTEDFAARSLRPAQTGANGAALAAQALEFLQSLREAADAERREMLIEYVRGHVARVLRREESDPIERRQRLMDLGIDSLMAVQLRNLLGAGLGLKQPLPATLIFNYPTVEVIAAYLEKEIFGTAENSPPAPDKNHQEEKPPLRWHGFPTTRWPTCC